jgi:Xaa-Pro aminopeptidase
MYLHGGGGAPGMVQIVHVMHGQNTDSKSWFERFTVEGLDPQIYETELLYPALREARVCKSEEEINVLRYVAKVSSQAHVKVCAQATLHNKLRRKFNESYLQHNQSHRIPKQTRRLHGTVRT